MGNQIRCDRSIRFLAMALVFSGWLNAARASEIEIFSYNVENLFDVEHDKDKEDWEFLPKSHPLKASGCKSVQSAYRKQCFETDWTEEKLEWKISNLKKVIDEHGSLPDIMAVVEVENLKVLEKLAKRLGYDGALLTNSPDERGIDVGLMYRSSSKHLKFEGTQEKAIDSKLLPNATRNLFEARFTLDGKPLAVYVNHFPSPRSPAKERVVVAQELKRFMAAALAKEPKLFQIAVGDFNIIPDDKPNDAADTVLLTSDSGEPLDEVEKLFWAYHKDLGDEDKVREEVAGGTYFYVSEALWNSLDRFFVRQAKLSKSPIQVVPESFQIVRVPSNKNDFTFKFDAKKGGVIVKKKGHVERDIPRKFFPAKNTQDALGVSDHFPVAVKLRTAN